jgi:aryl-alcohol dehydrogenase-like predicted oxidoreductase
LRTLADRHHATPAAIALAWAISYQPVVVIPGASSISQVEANAAAADITLSADEQQALAAAARLSCRGPGRLRLTAKSGMGGTATRNRT